MFKLSMRRFKKSLIYPEIKALKLIKLLPPPEVIMKVLAQHGWFELSLRHTCIMIGAGILAFLGFEALFSKLLVRNVDVFSTWAVGFAVNVLLVISATMEWKYLLIIWLLYAALIIIGVPIAVLSIFFKLGFNYYVKDFSHPKSVLLCEYIIAMFMYIYFGRFVLSYTCQLIHIRNIPTLTDNIICPCKKVTST